jgi:hypothetical protein
LRRREHHDFELIHYQYQFGSGVGGNRYVNVIASDINRVQGPFAELAMIADRGFYFYSLWGVSVTAEEVI